MSKKLDEHQISPRLRHPARRRILNRLVGLGFAAPAVGNAVGTMRQAPSFVRWLADGAWIPPYPWLLEHLAERPYAVVVPRSSSKQQSRRC
jgi:hypothetical protein